MTGAHRPTGHGGHEHPDGHRHDGEHSVTNLAVHVGAQPSAVSQHLAKLRLARVVRVRREGNRMFYAAENAHVRRLVEEALFHADHLVGGFDDHNAAASSAPAPRRRRA